MSNSGFDQRTNEIRDIHQKYKFFYQLMGGVFLVGIGILLGKVLFENDASYEVNLYTDLVSIAITVFVLDLWVRRRDERSKEQQLNEQLDREAASTSNEIAKNALSQLWHRGWWTGEMGLLKGANLYEANLSSASLGRVNMNGTILYRANLAQAQLYGADLRDALLISANLCGADLTNANLHGAVIDSAQFDEYTILPDGKSWKPSIDLQIYGCVSSKASEDKSSFATVQDIVANIPITIYQKGHRQDTSYDLIPKKPTAIAKSELDKKDEEFFETERFRKLLNNEEGWLLTTKVPLKHSPQPPNLVGIGQDVTSIFDSPEYLSLKKQFNEDEERILKENNVRRKGNSIKPGKHRRKKHKR